MNASNCTCKQSYIKVEDYVDPNIFGCALKDQCSIETACPNQNFVCLSNFATGDARCAAYVLRSQMQSASLIMSMPYILAATCCLISYEDLQVFMCEEVWLMHMGIVARNCK